MIVGHSTVVVIDYITHILSAPIDNPVVAIKWQFVSKSRAS